MSTTLEQFVVALSAKIDKASFQHMGERLNKIKTDVFKLTAVFGGLTTAVLAVSDHFARLGYEAQNAGSTIESMGKISYAIKQMGGHASNVKASLEHLFDFLHFHGAGATTFLNKLGVAVKKSNGQFRDTADIMTDLMGRLSVMYHKGGVNQAKAFMIAQRVGIDENTFKAMINHPDMLKTQEAQYEDVYARLGMNPNEAGQQSQQLMRQVNRLMLAIEVLGQKIAISLVHAFGGKTLDDFTNNLLAHGNDIAHVIDNMAKMAVVASQSLSAMADHIDHMVKATVGWKTVLEGVFGLFVVSKLAPILSIMTKLTGGTLGAAGRVAKGSLGILGKAARVVGLGAVGELFEGAGALAGTLLAPEVALPLAALGFGGYEAYKHWGAIKGWWHNTHFVSQAQASENPMLHSVLLQQRQQEAMNFFMSKGLSRGASAGIVGNLIQESMLGLNKKGGDGVGVAQWHSDRVYDIYKKFGIDVRNASFMEQLQAVYDEMQAGGDIGARRAGRLLEDTNNPYLAATIVRKLYERPSYKLGKEDKWRGGYAMEAYNVPTMHNNINVTVNGHGDPKAIASAVSGKINQQWHSWKQGVSPRQLGMTGAS